MVKLKAVFMLSLLPNITWAYSYSAYHHRTLTSMIDRICDILSGGFAKSIIIAIIFVVSYFVIYAQTLSKHYLYTTVFGAIFIFFAKAIYEFFF